MKPLVHCTALFFLVTAPMIVHAQDKLDAAARAKAVAPFVEAETVAVFHADLSRVAVEPLFEVLGKLLPDAKDYLANGQAEANQRVGQFLRAGGKDVFLVVTLGGHGLYPKVLAVLPLRPGMDEKAVRASLAIPPDQGQRMGDALVIRLLPVGKEPLEIHAAPRPELAAAFDAAGDTAVQGLVIPPAYARRVIEELMPQLPKQIGNGPSTVLTRGLSWAAADIHLAPHLALRVVVKSPDAQAAEALRAKWAEIVRFVGQQKEVRRIVPEFDKLAALSAPKVEGDRLVVALDETTAPQAISTLVKVVEVPVAAARAAAGRSQSANNLKQIGLAVHGYYDVHKHFPSPASHGPDGKPLLSWRVHILPFVEQQQLYQQFHLNEPWDSPHNKTLIDKMPPVFRSPKSRLAEKGRTNCLAPVGDGALFRSPRDEPQFKDVRDGTSNTIMAVEMDDQHAVIWTKPDDLAFDPKDPKKGIGSPYEHGFQALFCDGSVRFISRTIVPKTLSALFTRAGREPTSGSF